MTKTSVMLGFDSTTIELLNRYCLEHGITNTLDYDGKPNNGNFHYHITLYYTDTPNELVSMDSIIPSFNVQLYGLDFFGENKDIPVLLLNPNGKLQELFDLFGNSFGLKSNWPSFKPHISLSYDKKIVTIMSLPRFPLVVNRLIIDKKEYTTEEIVQESELVIKPIFMNKTDSTITIDINGVKYEYFIDGNVESVYKKFKDTLKFSPGKALNFIKNIASRYEKLSEETLNKPYRLPTGSKKKFGVKVKSDSGNTIEVKFGDPNLSIKRDDPERRKSFRARHDCENKKDKTTPGYWSCKFWSKKNVSDMV